MSRNEIIKEFTDNLKDFQKLAFNIAGEQDAPDLMQLCTLELLEFNDERLIAAYNPAQGLKPFFIRMLCNQYKSTTSKFHKLYRKQEQEIQKKGNDIIYNEPQSVEDYEPGYFEKINDVLQGIYDQTESKEVAELNKMVWEIYVEKGSLRKTLAAIPEQYAEIFDLKTVHEIVKAYQRTLKAALNIED